MDGYIDYAPGSPRHRETVRRALISILAAIMLIPIGWKAGPPAWQHIRLLYWQRRALNYLPPADHIVYDQTNAVTREVTAKPWEQFCKLFFSRFKNATLFLHERRNSRGEVRLVALEALHADVRTGLPPFLINVCVLRPGGAFMEPTALTDYFESLGTGLADSDLIRCFAGQPDSADSSHLTVKCQVKDRTIIIDGWLQDDDRVVLELRNPSSNQRDSIRLTKRPE